MSRENAEKRAWRLFENRFLRKADSPDTQQQIENRLDDKVAGLDRSGQELGKLRRVVREASELWAHRSGLRKRDVLYLAASLLYFISPLDAIPDVLPGIGYIDDVVVLSSVVGIILKSLSSLGTRGKEQLEEWIDQRAEVVFERFDESATSGMQKTVAAVVIGLWGTTTAAAISFSVATALGGYPAEWIAYVVLTASFIAACNILTCAYYWREYRRLDGKWQKRLGTLVASKFTLPHFAAIALPILALIGLGIGRALFSA
jgi:uncharacterized membrane protein YkvA (DUF1232 family)